MQKYWSLLTMGFLLLIAACSQTISEDAKPAVSQEVVSTGIAKGQIPPDFQIRTNEGNQINLRSFHEQNKPVLVYFMATWCPFCAKDFAALSEIYASYEDVVPIVVMSLDLTEDYDLLQDYKKRYPELNSVIFNAGTGTVLSAYQVKHTTTKYAVGRGGSIIYAGSGAFSVDQWKTLLAGLKSS